MSTASDPNPRPLGALQFRDARPDDRDGLAANNAAMALETEGKVLDHETVARGVAAALADPARLRYWVADCDGVVVGQAAITAEWSDWRDGWIWWIQSVYVHRGHRGAGVFKRLLGRIQDTATAQGDVVALRLYVEQSNTRAQAAYHSLGLQPSGYIVYERPLTPAREG